MKALFTKIEQLMIFMACALALAVVLSGCSSSKPLFYSQEEWNAEIAIKKNEQARIKYLRSFTKVANPGMDISEIKQNLGEPDERLANEKGEVLTYNDEVAPLLVAFNPQGKLIAFQIDTVELDRRARRKASENAAWAAAFQQAGNNFKEQNTSSNVRCTTSSPNALGNSYTSCY